ISVKEWDFSLGNPASASALPPPVHAQSNGNGFVLVDPDGFGTTHVLFSRRGAESDDGGVAFAVTLPPRESWELRVDVFVGDTEPERPEQHFGQERRRVEDSLSAWRLRVPRIRASWVDLRLSFERSVADLAALR